MHDHRRAWAAAVLNQSLNRPVWAKKEQSRPVQPPRSADGCWDYQAAEGRHTTLSGRERQVVILAVGAVWHAPYELYSHSAAARTAGLSPEQVDALAGGGMPDQLSAREQCAWRFAPAHG